MPSFKLTSYNVDLRRSQGQLPAAYIRCDLVDGSVVGITFLLPGVPLPDNTLEPLVPDNPDYASLFYARIYAPPEQLPWYLDLLRNENVWVYVQTGYPNRNELQTSSANVGWGHFA